jgi:tyrosyl-tRNA synthetase
VEQGGVYVNEQSVRDPDAVLDAATRIDGRWTLLRAGKKRRHLLVFQESG